MPSKPRVSVLLPVYNTKEEYLRAAIESILKQTYTNFELIILNDASTDENVEKVVKSYEDSRIRYEKNKYNLGISRSRNKLIDLAKGEYLAVMDHDDLSLPERLKKQVSFLDDHPEYGVVGCWPEILGREGMVNQLPVEDCEIQETLTLMICICHPAVMIRKNLLEQTGIRYENEYTPAEDYQIFARLIGKTKFYNIPEVLFLYRSHETNTSKVYHEKIEDAAIKIRNFIQRDNPELCALVNAKIARETKVEFLNLFSIIIKECGNIKTYSLFGVPFLKLRTKKVMSWHKYMKKSLF